MQLPIFFNLQQLQSDKNLTTTKAPKSSHPLENYHPFEKPSSLVVLQISNSIHYISIRVCNIYHICIYIYLHMSCSHGQSGGAHQTASKGWRWSLGRTSKDLFYRFVSDGVKGAQNWNMLCVFSCIDSKNMLHITRLIHTHNMLTVPLTKRITDKRPGVWVSVTCFYWKFGFPERICPPRLILLLYIVLWQDMAGCQNFLERVEQQKYAVYSMQYTLL